MPALRQASMSSVPAGAVSFFPSTVNMTSGIRCLRSLRGQSPDHFIRPSARVNSRPFKAAVCLYDCQLRNSLFCKLTQLSVQVIFELLAKLFEERDGRHGCGVAQRAKG